MPRTGNRLAEVAGRYVAARRAGAPDVEERLAELEAALAGPAPGAGPLQALTPTQHKILEMLAHGDGNAEVAGALGIRPGTLKVHCTAMFKALGARNRMQAIDAYWRAMGEARGVEGAMARLPKVRALIAVGG